MVSASSRVNLIAVVVLLSLMAGFWFVPVHADRGALPTVEVIDGDTIEVDGTMVQLYGIDAPELGQLCGQDGRWVHCGVSAAFELHKIISLARQPVICTQANSNDRNSPAICTIGTVDLSHSMLITGYAVAAPDATPDYQQAEKSAREGSLGLWHKEFVPPSEWRAGRRLAREPEPETGACPIKAVVRADGDRVFLVPTDEAFASATVDPRKGDRVFCSDEEARAAGWHHALTRPRPAG